MAEVSTQLPQQVIRTGHAKPDDQLQAAIHRSLLDLEGDDLELQEALRLSLQTDQRDPGERMDDGSPALRELLLSLGLRRLDVGSTNLSESGNILANQCLYLAVARSWLAAPGCGLLVRDSALQLKREIEAAVLAVRGEAAERDLGEEAEAYADFLACALIGEGPAAGSAVTDLAIVVFVSSGGMEAYEGKGYGRLPRDQQTANLAMVWHRPGHFEAVVAAGGEGKLDLTLSELLQYAESVGIQAALIRHQGR